MRSKPILQFIRKHRMAAIGIGALVIVGGLTTAYAGYVGSRVDIRPFSFQILEPSILVRGANARITWTTNEQNSARYPYEKIEFCAGLIVPKCTVLALSVRNTGSATVTVPTTLPLGKGRLKLTARTANQLPVWGTTTYRTVTVYATTPTATPTQTQIIDPVYPQYPLRVNTTIPSPTPMNSACPSGYRYVGDVACTTNLNSQCYAYCEQLAPNN